MCFGPPADGQIDQSGHIPAEALEAIFAIDGVATLGTIAADVAAARGITVRELEDTLRPLFLELCAAGLLEVVEQA